MRTIRHLIVNVGNSKIVQAFSTIWNAINQSSSSESEMSARVRYAVADKIMEEFEKKREQVAKDELAKKKNEQLPKRIMHIH